MTGCADSVGECACLQNSVQEARALRRTQNWLDTRKSGEDIEAIPVIQPLRAYNRLNDEKPPTMATGVSKIRRVQYQGDQRTMSWTCMEGIS